MNSNNEATEIEIGLTDNRKYMLEQMRQSLDLDDFQSVVVMAFMELLSSNDLTFSDEIIEIFTDSVQVPEENTEGIIVFQRPNILSVLLPIPQEKDWLQILENHTAQKGVPKIVALSLEKLYTEKIL